MKMRIAIFDVDGTLIRGFFFQKFPYFLFRNGLFSFNAVKKMDNILKKFRDTKYGYKKFTYEWYKAYATGLKDKKQVDIQKAGQKFISEHTEYKFSFTDGLVNLVRRKGYVPVIVSGTASELISPFASSLRIEVYFTSTYGLEDGRFTGDLISNCAIDETKREVVRTYIQKNSVDAIKSTAFGDTYHDITVLEQVGYPVAIKPNEKLKKVAMERGWLICTDDNAVVSSVDPYLP